MLLNDKETTEDFNKDALIEEIEKEVDRRKNLGKNYLERRRVIQSTYQKLHPDIFTLQERFLAPEFIRLVDYCKDDDANFEDAFEFVQTTNVERNYAVKVFTEEFCRLFLEEIQHFENSDCPKGRPNTMNRYGVLLDEIGFDSFMTDLREKYLQPITRVLFPDWGGGKLDSHKAFIVEYTEAGDKDLSYHYDNAEVTLNVALSPKHSYDGGNLYFGKMRTDTDYINERVEHVHEPTVGIIHRGQQKHGASPITRGERYNLIMWMRASCVRNKLCPMCDRAPDLVETVGFGDGFTKPDQPVVDVCSMI